MEDLNYNKTSSRSTIIIPAHNEENVIKRLLDEIKKISHIYTIVVSCNGCTDSTEDIVEKYSPEIFYVSTGIGSKTNALNLAEEQIKFSLPCLYLDADVIISCESIVSLLNCAQRYSYPVLVVPKLVMNIENSSFLVKQYYKYWLSTRYCLIEGYGRGMYVLNETARKAFDNFPDVISDDGFVRCVIPNLRIIIDNNSTVTIKAPKNLIDLINIKTRSKLGNYQLRMLGYVPNIFSPNKNCKNIVDFSVVSYFLINFISMIKAKFLLKKIHTYKWQKDYSNR